jgi:hypothetical protein
MGSADTLLLTEQITPAGVALDQTEEQISESGPDGTIQFTRTQLVAAYNQITTERGMQYDKAAEAAHMLNALSDELSFHPSRQQKVDDVPYLFHYQLTAIYSLYGKSMPHYLDYLKQLLAGEGDVIWEPEKSHSAWTQGRYIFDGNTYSVVLVEHDYYEDACSK